MERGKYFQSNLRTRVYLDAMRELLSHRGLRMVLRLAALREWQEQLPPYDDELGVDFADFSALSEALILAYGPGGGGSVAMRGGRMMFRAMRERFGAEVGLDAPLTAAPAAERVRQLLPRVVRGWELQSDSRITLAEMEPAFILAVAPCPECWGHRETVHTVCYATVGFLQEALEWGGVGDAYHAVQHACAACVWDQGKCEFVVSLLE